MDSGMAERVGTIIVGGGLAGLSCAVRLAQSGTDDVVVVEATDRVGGRVRTERYEGFTLDHGFQVLLTAYPACRELLDYRALRLRPFEPGALIRQGGQFRLLGDPWRRPAQALSTALHPVGTWADKLRIARLRARAAAGSLEQLYERPQSPTLERLRADGFSPRMIDQFFRPFLGGVFLDESLACPSRMLEFVFRMFAGGDVAIPADGMDAIPRQLAERLPRGSLRLRSTAMEIETGDSGLGDSGIGGAAASTAAGAAGGPIRLRLGCGRRLVADRLVVAVESDAAARLLGQPALKTEWAGTTNLYYASQNPPDRRRLLMLRGDEQGPVQTAVVLSNVAPEYAPPGQALISVSIDPGDSDPELGDVDALDRHVLRQLGEWFGPQVSHWHRLPAFRVPCGLPRLSLDPIMAPTEVRRLHGQEIPEGKIYVCGDHRETPSIQGAMNSGLRVADAILSTTPS